MGATSAKDTTRQRVSIGSRKRRASAEPPTLTSPGSAATRDLGGDAGRDEGSPDRLEGCVVVGADVSATPTDRRPSARHASRRIAAFLWRLVLAWPLRWPPAMLTLHDLNGETGTGARAARNRLICSAIPMVHAIANQVQRMQARALVSHEELVSCGLLDVVRAADAFDASANHARRGASESWWPGASQNSRRVRRAMILTAGTKRSLVPEWEQLQRKTRRVSGSQ